jgi:hypothetical protein
MSRKLSGLSAWLLQATGVALLILGLLLVPEQTFGAGGASPPCGGTNGGGGGVCAQTNCTSATYPCPNGGCSGLNNCQCTCKETYVGSGACGCY